MSKKGNPKPASTPPKPIRKGYTPPPPKPKRSSGNKK